MKGFIEVTDVDKEAKVLISVSQIKFICALNESTSITFNCVKNGKFGAWNALSIYTDESYDEVVAKINQAINE